jgi:AbiU2
MTYRTAEQAKAYYVEKMGEALGSEFAALWQEAAYGRLKCNEFIELFGNDPSRVDLINKTASGFFSMIRGILWEDLMLHVARIIDPPKSRSKSNLRIQNLPKLIDDDATKKVVEQLVETTLKKTEFCRDWRKRHIAHRDRASALEQAAEPLARIDIPQMKAALAIIEDVLNSVERHYTGSATMYTAVAGRLSDCH